MRTWTRDNAFPIGPWTNEPDKAQWIDEATGLDCLIVRNRMGALCGYVGVPEGHPAHRQDYDNVDADAHGGLTFAGGCHVVTRESWERWRAQMLTRQEEAAKFPQGDAARDWRTMDRCVDNYDLWFEHMQASVVCHVREEGRPDNIWWLGFDAAHSGDLIPAFCNFYSASNGTYRNLDYIREECRKLALQLSKLTV